ncbi:MAG: hypothetical protein WAV89_05560 [Ignavibacteriaceae bacterium]
MKTYILIALFLVSVSVNAQFKDQGLTQESPSDGIINKSSGSFLGFINPENFSMHHSFGLSYSTFAGQGVSLATYTNSMMYKFSDNMNVQLDASFITSPYSSLGKDFQNSLQGIYISKAAFNYKPWDDVSISVQYRSYPNYLYSPYNRYGNFGNSFYGGFTGYENDPFLF